MKTHDYTVRFWGHDFMISKIIGKGEEIHMAGWGSGLSKSDYLLLPNGATTTRYQILKVEYFSAPSDMWKVHARFAPRPPA